MQGEAHVILPGIVSLALLRADAGVIAAGMPRAIGEVYRAGGAVDDRFPGAGPVAAAAAVAAQVRAKSGQRAPDRNPLLTIRVPYPPA